MQMKYFLLFILLQSGCVFITRINSCLVRVVILHPAIRIIIIMYPIYIGFQ